MKRIVLIVSVILAAACARETVLCDHTQPVAVAPDATNGDQYIYTMTVSDFDFFKAGEYVMSLFGSVDMNPGGCSSTRNGNFHGRNLDFYVNEHADLVITTLAGKDRFASIGTSGTFPPCTRPIIEDGTITEEIYAGSCYYMTDGINENGVVVNCNVVPYGECERTTGTNPGKPAVLTNGVVRYILDHAKSVDHAVQLIKEDINIVVPSVEKFPFESHWMISDADKTVVVEIWNNEIVVVDDCVMTNFYLSHPDTDLGIGHERYQTLKKFYDEGATAEGMQALMSRVWYSKCYSTETEPLWLSEALDHGCGFTWTDIKEGKIDEAMVITMRDAQNYGSVEHQKDLRDGVNWYTTHSIVYDIENRTLSMIEQENDKAWKFSLK